LCPRKESYVSATSWVLDAISYKFIVRRASIYPPSIDENIDAEKKENILYTVRYVIQVLRSKSLIFLIPKRFVINIPLVLTYYRLNNANVETVYEFILKKYLNYNEGKNIMEILIKNYMPLYGVVINELLKAAPLYLEIISNIDWDRIIEIVHHYIPNIIFDEGAGLSRSITKELRDHILSSASPKIIDEFKYGWSRILSEIDRLCFHKDSHVESICNRFMNRVVQYTLHVLFPSHYESKSMFSLSFREELILCLIKTLGPISEGDLINLLYLLKNEKNIDLGYIFGVIIRDNKKYVTCNQAHDDIELLLSRGFLEEVKGKLNVSALGQRVLEKKGCSGKVKRIIEEARELKQESH